MKIEHSECCASCKRFSGEQPHGCTLAKNLTGFCMKHKTMVHGSNLCISYMPEVKKEFAKVAHPVSGALWR